MNTLGLKIDLRLLGLEQRRAKRILVKLEREGERGQREREGQRERGTERDRERE